MEKERCRNRTDYWRFKIAAFLNRLRNAAHRERERGLQPAFGSSVFLDRRESPGDIRRSEAPICGKRQGFASMKSLENVFPQPVRTDIRRVVQTSRSPQARKSA